MEKLKQTKLKKVKELHKLNYNQRGKWILSVRDSSSLKGINNSAVISTPKMKKRNVFVMGEAFSI